ncbi:MAG: nucleoside-diphosphate kinase [Phycisphaeraceae bacterium]|nr:MAG: nucleoside-diphosphate kinase [Phycisphaeraceae bacterium]
MSTPRRTSPIRRGSPFGPTNCEIRAGRRLTGVRIDRVGYAVAPPVGDRRRHRRWGACVTSPRPPHRAAEISSNCEETRSDTVQTTLIILKPDAVQRGVMGEIITRFERKGLQIVGCKMMRISQDLAATHYEAHKSKPFYDGLVRFMTSSPVLVMAIRGVGVIEISRKMMGATFGSKAEPGTIRGDFGVSNSYNLIHGSDSPEAAARELELFFGKDEVTEFSRSIDGWVYDLSSGAPE